MLGLLRRKHDCLSMFFYTKKYFIKFCTIGVHSMCVFVVLAEIIENIFYYFINYFINGSKIV